MAKKKVVKKAVKESGHDALQRDVDAVLKKHNVTSLVIVLNDGEDVYSHLQGHAKEVLAMTMCIVEEVVKKTGMGGMIAISKAAMSYNE